MNSRKRDAKICLDSAKPPELQTSGKTDQLMNKAQSSGIWFPLLFTIHTWRVLNNWQ